MWPFDIFSKFFNLSVYTETADEKETAELVAMITPNDKDLSIINIKLTQEIYELKAEILDLNNKINDFCKITNDLQ